METIYFKIYFFAVISFSHPITSEATCECGMSNSKRMVGGVEVQQNAYPWHVALYYLFPPAVNNGSGVGSVYRCGGSIINEYFILTAAHCLKNDTGKLMVPAENMFVVLGEHNRNITTETKEVWMGVQEMIPHEHYDFNGTFKNDIGLLLLTQPIKFSTTIRPICLPSPNVNYIGKTGITIGWGALSYDTDYHHLLLETDIPILKMVNCKRMYSGLSNDKQLCGGGYNGTNAICKGDSGGPLMIPDDFGIYTIVGITSFSFTTECDSPYPHVYTRVDSYLEWIGTKTRRTAACSKPKS